MDKQIRDAEFVEKRHLGMGHEAGFGGETWWRYVVKVGTDKCLPAVATIPRASGRSVIGRLFPVCKAVGLTLP